MVQIKLLGETFEVSPYKIKQLRQAAPLVDRINQTSGSLTSMQGGVEVASDLIAFVAIGLSRIQADLVSDNLEDRVGFDELPALQAAFVAIMEASGFRAGEAKAPAGTEATGGASTISSDESASASPQLD